eukprot:768245-Hanusia_phi.AAC.8
MTTWTVLSSPHVRCDGQMSFVSIDENEHAILGGWERAELRSYLGFQTSLSFTGSEFPVLMFGCSILCTVSSVSIPNPLSLQRHLIGEQGRGREGEEGEGEGEGGRGG